MYRREEGRYDYKRRDHREDAEDKGNNYKSSRRNRWDERKREGSSSSDRRMEVPRPSYESTNDRESSSGHSRERRRSRSRSRSPFRRDFRDYANPSKDEVSIQKETYNHSLEQQNNQRSSSRKNTSWSDSSDEDDPSGEKPNNSNNNTSVLNYGKSSQQQYYEVERKHQVPSTTITTQMKPSISEKDEGSSGAGISLKLGGSSKRMPLPKVISVSVPAKSSKVAAIFNTDDDDDEPEDMPPECKMRMKNVGRETKTSEGPNSFGKTKIGFCNMSHLTEKHLEGKTVPNKRP